MSNQDRKLLRFRVTTFGMAWWQYLAQRSIAMHGSRSSGLNTDHPGVFALLNTIDPFAGKAASLIAPLRLLRDHAPGGTARQRLRYIRSRYPCSVSLRACRAPQQIKNRIIHFHRKSRPRGNSNKPLQHHVQKEPLYSFVFSPLSLPEWEPCSSTRGRGP